jgi:hypothetical protein
MGAIRRVSPVGLPMGRSAPPERLEPTRQVSPVHGDRATAYPAGRTVGGRRTPYENVDAPTRGVRAAEKQDSADECEAGRR